MVIAISHSGYIKSLPLATYRQQRRGGVGITGMDLKKTEFGLYNTPIKADGIIAINIRDDDELVAVRRVDEGDEILMVSHAGLAARFREDSVRAQLRPASGVRGMDGSGTSNYVLAMDVARAGQDLLVVTENGYGKRTPIEEYRLTARGAKGVKTITFTETKGLLAAALVVREHEELVFISQNGMVQRTGVRGINRYGRGSQGVRVMNLREGDEVSAGALVVETEAPPEGAPAGQPISLDASGMADDAVAQGDVEGVISSDPVDEPDIVPDEAEPHQDDIG